MKKLLTNKELEVMEILWKSHTDLSITDFLERNPKMKTSTTQVALRSLLKKSYIKVENIVQHNKVFARTYLPVLTESNYFLAQLNSSSLKPNAFFSCFIEEQNNAETLDEMEEMIKKQKEKLSRKEK